MSQTADLLDEADAAHAWRAPRVPEFTGAPESGARATVAREATTSAGIGRMGASLAIAADGTFFAGVLMVAVAVRSAHPELFVYGHYFLDARAGVTVTSVLLSSMLMGAFTPRLARSPSPLALRRVLVLTIVSAGLFLGLQGFDTSAMAEQGLLPGSRYTNTQAVWRTAEFRSEHPDTARYADDFRSVLPRGTSTRSRHAGHTIGTEDSSARTFPLVDSGALGARAVYPEVPSEPRNAHLFFGLFHLAMGVHVLHVAIGMALWGWLLARTYSRRARFPSSTTFDSVSLYWSAVTLMRIVLFPLFYFA